MTVHIRKAARSQLGMLIGFVKAFHELENIQIAEDQMTAAVEALMTRRELGAIWVIYENNSAVGYIAICKGFSIEFGGYDGFIDEFYIAPDFRGKGLGTAVLELIRHEAGAMGVQALHLEVAKTNHRAKRLYERLGFIPRDRYLLMSMPTANS